ncbi:MAG: hypothetical protein MUQ56_15080 [Thermoleophilia bacterium]|nr:hypothetical protein [Thermoleophilia bacterium]
MWVTGMARVDPSVHVVVEREEAEECATLCEACKVRHRHFEALGVPFAVVVTADEV